MFVSFLVSISEIRLYPSLGRLWTWCCVSGSWDEQLRVSVTFLTVSVTFVMWLVCIVKVLWKSYRGRLCFLLLNWVRWGFPRKNTVSSPLFPQLSCFWFTPNTHSKQISRMFWNNKKSKDTIDLLLCSCDVKSIKIRWTQITSLPFYSPSLPPFPSPVR